MSGASVNVARYGADPLPELLKQQQPLNWLVEGWLEQGVLSCLIGAESSFKTFAAVDIALSVATGRPWHGNRTMQGRTLYIAGEGRVGVIRRMRAWCSHHEAVADELLLGRAPVELTTPGDADAIAELGGFSLVILDTLARNFSGNENDAQDVGAAIRHADRIRERTGAAVMILHHAPLEGRAEGVLRPRGSSALAGAADMIATSAFDKESKVVTLTSIKQKDAPNPGSLFLSFEVVDLGQTDNFGNPLTSCVLCPTHKRPAQKKTLGKNQKRLIQHLRSMANGSPELLVSVREVTDALGIRSRQGRLNLEDWFRDQPWSRPSAGGHVVDLEALPNP